MWQISEATAHYYADLATIATAMIAGLAAAVALLIYIGERRAERESFAKDLVREFTLLAFENPKFSDPELAAIDYSKKTFDGSAELFSKYEWFVDIMLWADNEILTMANTKRWRRYVRNCLDTHREYLRAGLYEKYEYYFAKPLRQLMQDVKSGNAVVEER